MDRRTLLITRNKIEYPDGRTYTATPSSLRRINRLYVHLPAMGGWRMAKSEWRKGGWNVV